MGTGEGVEESMEPREWRRREGVSVYASDWTPLLLLAATPIGERRLVDKRW